MEGNPQEKYLYDTIAFDSDIEKKNIMEEINEVTVFGKIPKNSIKMLISLHPHPPGYYPFIALPVWQDKVADQYYIYFAFYLLLNMHSTHLLDLLAPVIVLS